MYVPSKSEHLIQTRHHPRGRILTVGRNSTVTLETGFFCFTCGLLSDCASRPDYTLNNELLRKLKEAAVV